jgi:glycosyltransferase involved in cell wall biosynthesis
VEITNVGIYTSLKWLDYLVFLACVPFYFRRNAVLIANFFVTYWPVRLLSAFTGAPYIYFVQDIESKYVHRRGAVLNAFCNRTYRDRKIVAANPYLSDRLSIEFGTKARSICVGPDECFFEKPTTRIKTHDVIYFLRKEPWKRLDRFRRFLELSKGRLSCLCVTQDDVLLASAWEGNVEVRKPGNDRELIECFDSARFLLLTSSDEGFSLPPLEGMARGLPAVLFRCGGPDAYIVDGGNAVYVESEVAAVDAIDSIKNDVARYERMRSEAVATAARYRLQRSLAQMLVYITECGKW